VDLRAHLGGRARGAREVKDAVGFLDGVGEGLLAVDGEAGAQRERGWKGVGVVGRRDEDAIELELAPIAEELAEVGVDGRTRDAP
jgi:hypothetical protein